MILGSHNSWSYLPPVQWWLRPFAFMARCQNMDIRTQYEKYGVRCFDLRIRTDENGIPFIAHGFTRYKYTFNELTGDLEWLNEKGDCLVRLLNEVRFKCQHTDTNIQRFVALCQKFESTYSNIRFWCGRNTYNWAIDYSFGEEPTCEENYASVSKPRLIDDWFPWLYAKCCNHKILEKGTDKEILLMDFVGIL